MESRTFKLSEIAAALDVPLARIRTMRARKQTACWDAELDERQEAGREWRDYYMTDAVALACVLELVERGLSADEAAKIVVYCRKFIMAGPHPHSASRIDIWVGRLIFIGGGLPIGGPLCDLLLEIDQRVRGNIKAAPEGAGGGVGLILVNASNHYRRLMEKLA